MKEFICNGCGTAFMGEFLPANLECVCKSTEFKAA